MAAEPQRTSQPVVNGQNEDGSPRGNADRETVGEQSLEQHEHRVRGPPQLNWPRQQRPQEFGRGYPPQQNRLPVQGVIRRASPWTVLKTKLPDQPVRPGNEHLIQRMQNPDGSMMRGPEPNGLVRPPSGGMMRPPNLSRPPSQENTLGTPGGSPGGTPGGTPQPPRSPFLQRMDSRTSPNMPPGMQRPMSGARPPSAMSTGRSMDDDDDIVMTGQSRPGSARPMQSPVGVRPGSGPPVRPQSRTPPQSPAQGMIPQSPSPGPPQSPSPGPPQSPSQGPPIRSPQPARQPSLSSLSEQNEIKTEGPVTRPPSVQSPLRPPSAAPITPTPETVNQPPKALVNGDKSPPVFITEPDDVPKRPTDLTGTLRAEKDAPSTNGEIKEATSGPIKKDPVVNGNQESPKKSPTKAAAPKKLGNVTPVKSPSKISPKTPDTPGTADKKNENEEKSEPKNQQSRVHFAQEVPPVIEAEKSEQRKTPASPKKLATQKPYIIKQDSLQSLPETPLKLPMNKVQVGAAPSPNLKAIKSKIGSLENASHKPGGGKVKIENRKLTFSAAPKIAAKNDTYTPKGGEKKIPSVKLQWNAKSKIGSLENATHKPGGGDKKIESVKLDFKEKAKPKVGSKDNIKHTPGGGAVKNSGGSQDGNPSDIEDQKLEIKATSKIGSLENVKHKPGGGEIKIFDDKEYLKQMAGPSSDVHSASHQGKKSRSNSSSRQKLNESISGTNLAEEKSPEKAKPSKPTDQNSNTVQKKDANGNGKEQKPEIVESTRNPPVVKAPTFDLPKPPVPTQTNGVTKLIEKNHPSVVEKSLIEKTEKEIQNVDLNKH